MNAAVLLSTLALAGEPAPAVVLEPGASFTLRIRQVLPDDGLSPAERLLNSLPPLRPGDGFVAEVVVPPGDPVPLLTGTVVSLTPPGWFGRPGRLTLELTQCYVVPGPGGHLTPWRLSAADERYLPPKKRRFLSALLALEGLGVGASLAAQFQPVKSGWVGAGAGIGLVVGTAYAACLPGREASLDPGDTFRVTVGSAAVEQVPPETPPTLHPAQAPHGRKGKP
jgi:hypothetical protein